MLRPEYLCGRPTKRGEPCRCAPVLTGGGCAAHLTPEERDEHDARVARAQSMFVRHLPTEPACWSWPVDAPVAADDITGPVSLGDWQRNRCAVCGRYDSAWVLDHDHATALIRGYLCRSCNAGEATQGGVFDLYRERNPASMLGISARYYSVVTGWAKPAAPEFAPEGRWKANPLSGVGL